MCQPSTSRPPEPAVSENQFRGRYTGAQAVRPFSEARPLLPVPVLPDHQELVEMYWRAWELTWNRLRRPSSGSSLAGNYLQSDGEDYLDVWDVAFVTHFGVYGRRAFPFVRLLDNFYARQHEDGFICRQVRTGDGCDAYYPFDPDSTGPNILAWSEWRTYRLSGDESRLEGVVWPLLAYHRWLRANRTWPSGLYWATGTSIHMPDQTRVPDGGHHHRHWSWIDATAQAALDCSTLEKMATLLGRGDVVAEVVEEHAKLEQRLNERMWNEGAGFYQDIDRAGQFSSAKSIAAYWMLLDTGLVPSGRVDAFVQQLRNKDGFYRPHMVPSLSADSEGYTGDSTWRGAVWPETNFMILKGLRAAGLDRRVHEVAANHLQNLSTVYQHTDAFWENYAADRAEPGQGAAPNAVSCGLSAIATLLEDFIGLWSDWPLRRVVWHRYLQSSRQYGVLNFPLGDEGSMDILGDDEHIVVRSDTPFTLVIRSETLNLQVLVSVGTTEVELA